MSNKKTSEMTDHELMQEMVEQGRTSLRLAYVSLTLRVAVIAAIVILGAICIPKINEEYQKVAGAVEEVQQMADEVEQAALDVQSAMDSVEETSDNMNTVVNGFKESVDKFSESVKSLNPLNAFR